MGTTLVLRARETHAHRADARLAGMSNRTLLTWYAMLTMGDDLTGTYELGWRQLSFATGMVSERTVMRHLSFLRELGLIEPLPRRPGSYRAYLLHP